MTSPAAFPATPTKTGVGLVLLALLIGCGRLDSTDSPGGERDGEGSTGPTLLAEAPQQGPVRLGAAGSFVILARDGISTVASSAINGDVAVSPAASATLTGFSLTPFSTGAFSTSSRVTGKVYAADHAAPTPSNLSAAITDMELAFTEAAGRPPDVTDLGAGNIGAMTLSPGVYRWGTAVEIPSHLTLTGSQTDVWIFQVGRQLTVGTGTRILLTQGAMAKNVFWQVTGPVQIGAGARFEGIVLTQAAVTLEAGSSVNGRLFAQATVSTDSCTVADPMP